MRCHACGLCYDGTPYSRNTRDGRQIMRMTFRFRQFLSLLPALCCLATGGCGGDPATDSQTLSGMSMGTSYQVRIDRLPPGFTPAQLEAGIGAVLERIDAGMSTYREDSELNRLNRAAAAEWTEISPELYRVLDLALQVSRRTGGAFDITVGPVVELWGFGPARPAERIPDRQHIADALQRVGYEQLLLRPSPPALRKVRPDVAMDLSGIAKGYAVDQVADYLTGLGIGNYLVEIGGEIRAAGRNHRGEPWRIGIEKPLTDQRAIERVIGLADTGMATSGDYRNYFLQDGVRYSHTIDPRTGRPVTHALASVTVLHPLSALADALATGLLVLGPEDGPALAEREAIAALFQIHTADGFHETATTAFRPYLAADAGNHDGTRQAEQGAQ